MPQGILMWYEKLGIVVGVIVGVAFLAMAVYLGVRFYQKKRP